MKLRVMVPILCILAFLMGCGEKKKSDHRGQTQASSADQTTNSNPKRENSPSMIEKITTSLEEVASDILSGETEESESDNESEEEVNPETGVAPLDLPPEVFLDLPPEEENPEVNPDPTVTTGGGSSDPIAITAPPGCTTSLFILSLDGQNRLTCMETETTQCNPSFSANVLRSMDECQARLASFGNVPPIKEELPKFRDVPSGVAYNLVIQHQRNRCVSTSMDLEAHNNVDQWSCMGRHVDTFDENANQKFFLNPVGDGYYQIRRYNTDKCLDVFMGSEINGANVSLITCHAGDNQKFIAHKVDDNVFQFQNKQTKKCLDVRSGTNRLGENIYQWDCHGGLNQRFALETHLPISRKVPPGLALSLKNIDNGKCLDIQNFSKDNGTQHATWPCHGDLTQKFIFEKVMVRRALGTSYWNGAYRLRNSFTNKCVDVLAYSKDNMAPIGQWDCHDGPNQQFLLHAFAGNEASNIFNVVSVYNSKCLETLGYNKDDNALIGQFDCHAGKNQQWRIVNNPRGMLAASNDRSMSVTRSFASLSQTTTMFNPTGVHRECGQAQGMTASARGYYYIFGIPGDYIEIDVDLGVDDAGHLNIMEFEPDGRSIEGHQRLISATWIGNYKKRIRVPVGKEFELGFGSVHLRGDCHVLGLSAVGGKSVIDKLHEIVGPETPILFNSRRIFPNGTN